MTRREYGYERHSRVTRASLLHNAALVIRQIFSACTFLHSEVTHFKLSSALLRRGRTRQPDASRKAAWHIPPHCIYNTRKFHWSEPVLSIRIRA